jgi:hypothetical protein
LAAAEAKLDVRGEGIVVDARTDVRLNAPKSRIFRRRRASGLMYLKGPAV